MGFRKKKPGADDRRAWGEWLDRHRRELQEMGLPPEVSLSREHWLDFVENGHLHWHPQDSTGFEFSSLDRNQMERLLGFLDRHPEFSPASARLTGYLRVRLAEGQA